MTKTNQDNNELIEAIKANTYNSALLAYYAAQNILSARDPDAEREFMDDSAICRFMRANYTQLVASVCHLAYLYDHNQIPEFGKEGVEKIIRETMEKEVYYEMIMDDYKDNPKLSIVAIWDRLRNKKK